MDRILSGEIGGNMPITIQKKDGYEVRTPHGIKAKNTTKTKAKAQERLLNAIEHNPDFKPGGWRNKHRASVDGRRKKR